jgi:hypothetical protein
MELNSVLSDAHAFVFIEGLFWGMVGVFHQKSTSQLLLLVQVGPFYLL